MQLAYRINPSVPLSGFYLSIFFATTMFSHSHPSQQYLIALFSLLNYATGRFQAVLWLSQTYGMLIEHERLWGYSAYNTGKWLATSAFSLTRRNSVRKDTPQKKHQNPEVKLGNRTLGMDKMTRPRSFLGLGDGKLVLSPYAREGAGELTEYLYFSLRFG